MLVTISARTGGGEPSARPESHGAAAAFGTMVSVSGPAELPVAVFDSGVGGLTVLHELLVSLPSEDYVYLGDTARFPYGERSQAELQAFAVRDRRPPARARRQAPGGGLQRRQLGGAARRSSATWSAPPATST